MVYIDSQAFVSWPFILRKNFVYKKEQRVRMNDVMGKLGQVFHERNRPTRSDTTDLNCDCFYFVFCFVDCLQY